MTNSNLGFAESDKKCLFAFFIESQFRSWQRKLWRRKVEVFVAKEEAAFITRSFESFEFLVKISSLWQPKNVCSLKKHRRKAKRSASISFRWRLLKGSFRIFSEKLQSHEMNFRAPGHLDFLWVQNKRSLNILFAPRVPESNLRWVQLALF